MHQQALTQAFDFFNFLVVFVLLGNDSVPRDYLRTNLAEAIKLSLRRGLMMQML